ncbi:MAG: 1,2-phenylacetyl-CoA epoxidase subunit PaaC [Planctomycetota bacterium]
MTELTATRDADFANYLLRLGDSHLVIGHRLSAWCGHGPMLEEDIAMTNIALDCIGHASVLLRLAGQADGTNRSEDDLAYFREAIDFRNILLAEQRNGDFAQTMARQFLFSAWAAALYDELSKSTDPALAAAAEKFSKEVAYHLRHCREWMLRLGDGTEESRRRLQDAIDDLWPYTGELFQLWPGDAALIERKLIPHPERLQPVWSTLVTNTLSAAKITIPRADVHMFSGGPIGKHTEQLGYLLAEMQIVARSYPGSSW